MNDWLLLIALLQEEQEVPDIFAVDRFSNYGSYIFIIESILNQTPVGKLLVFRVKLELVATGA